MSLGMNYSELNKLDDEQIKLLQLLCNMEVSFITMGWYAGDVVDRVQLPENEQLIALSLGIASLGETLHCFDQLFKEDNYIDQFELSEEIRDAWQFLKTEEVKDFKKKVLKFVRDKSVYHMDKETILSYASKVSDRGSVLVWKFDESNHIKYSPLVYEIFGNQLLEANLDSEDTARMSNKIFLALRKVVFALLLERFNISEIKD